MSCIAAGLVYLALSSLPPSVTHYENAKGLYDRRAWLVEIEPVVTWSIQPACK